MSEEFSIRDEVIRLGQLLKAFAMPVLTLTCVIVAQMMRMTRAAVIDQLEAPYVEMVRLKGASALRLRALGRFLDQAQKSAAGHAPYDYRVSKAVAVHDYLDSLRQSRDHRALCEFARSLR